MPKLKQKSDTTTNTNKATCSKAVATVQEKVKSKKTVILTSSGDEMNHVTDTGAGGNMNADTFTVTETVNTVRTIEPKQGQVIINGWNFFLSSIIVHSDCLFINY